MRLDKFLALSWPEHSRAFWQRMIGEHRVRVNGHPLRCHQEVYVGDEIVIEWPVERPVERMLPEGELEILYEDVDLVVLNKPAGVVVHPAYGHATGTLIEQVVSECGLVPEEFGDQLRPGLIHRLDMDTSGALLVAKNAVSQNFLGRMMQEKKFEKRYVALTVGVPSPAEGLIDAPIGRARSDRRKMVVTTDSGSKEARTKYWVRGVGGLGEWEIALVELELLTGRTHQIRAHMVAMGTPVLGDKKYGNDKVNALAEEQMGLGRQALHAYYLRFPHPEGGEVEVRAPLPLDVRRVVEGVGVGWEEGVGGGKRIF